MGNRQNRAQVTHCKQLPIEGATLAALKTLAMVLFLSMKPAWAIGLTVASHLHARWLIYLST